MSRHRKSRANKVMVNPDATQNYVVGVLTGGGSYVSGVLEGASLYQGWVQSESTLEGRELGEYKKDSFRKMLANPTLRRDLERAFSEYMKNPSDVTLGGILDDLAGTNYPRLAKTDEYMIEAGRNYKGNYETLYKSKNMQTGVSLLESYSSIPSRMQERVAGIISKIMYNP